MTRSDGIWRSLNETRRRAINLDIAKPQMWTEKVANRRERTRLRIDSNALFSGAAVACLRKTISEARRQSYFAWGCFTDFVL